MARYTGPVCRLCRRERMKLFLKGTKCDTMSARSSARPYPPGSTAAAASARASTCSSCARSRRRAASTACSRSSSATSTRRRTAQPGITGENLLRMLELRLDNVVFRAGFAVEPQPGPPVRAPRPRHVNGKRVTIPSYQVRKGDVVELAPKAQKMIVVRHNLDTLDRAVPQWLEVDGGRLQGDRARPAAARADRRARARAAHRRALLQVARLPARRPAEGCLMLIIQRPEIEAGEPEGNTPAVHHLAARARLRPHARQQPAPHAAVVDPRRGRHPGALRRRAPRVRRHPGCEGRRHRPHPEPQGPRAAVHVRGAGHAAPRQARSRRGHRRPTSRPPPTSRSSTPTSTSRR